MPTDISEHIETVVVGGGQAGLAVGFHLARLGRDFVILDAGLRIGDAWRTRWEGLRLFTPARYSGLPGMPFPGPKDALPTKDQVADYLESYASRMRLPVRLATRVNDVWPDADEGFLVDTAAGRIRADDVVVATGAFAHPRIPDVAAGLDAAIVQLHSSGFHDPSQLADGDVLVVGASNSGAEIALIVAASHRTMLVGPDRGKMPIRPESLLARIVDPFFLFFLNHIATVRTPIGRRALVDIRDHGGPLERVWPEDLARAGVERVVARVVATRDGRPVLEGGEALDVANVIWCTGFAPSYGWIHLPITGSDGWPEQERGVVPARPGLYFIGLPALYSGASGLLGGVGRDAAHVAEQLNRRRRSAEAAAERTARKPSASAPAHTRTP
jgi:putative flavoprotein involved in K+ transport